MKKKILYALFGASLLCSLNFLSAVPSVKYLVQNMLRKAVRDNLAGQNVAIIINTFNDCIQSYNTRHERMSDEDMQWMGRLSDHVFTLGLQHDRALQDVLNRIATNNF